MATFVKMDIFKGLLWYTYKENRIKWYKLTLDQVNEIIELNKKGEEISSLEEYEADLFVDTKVDFENVVGQDSLTRFDKAKRRNKRRSKRKNQQKPAQNNQQTAVTSKKKKRRPPNKRANNIKNV